MYNRENFQFNNKQRIESDVSRIEMQVKRFELMREDVRDLVKLTASRMDIFHVVGALFLHFCIALFCEGHMKGAPTFLVAMFFLSNASAFVYLLLAVWLSMHATVASHSYGVRLLTRYVRLPIPSAEDLDKIAVKLATYEQTGLAYLLRVPFAKMGAKFLKESKDASTTLQEEGSSSTSTFRRRPPPSSDPNTMDRRRTSMMRKTYSESADRLGTWSRGIQPGQHVRLFHELQGKWQPYDAYCRVCMYLGLMQILNTLTFFIIHHTLVENYAPGVGFSLVLIFQVSASAVSDLDMTGIEPKYMRMIDMSRLMPCILTLFEVVFAPRDLKNGQITNKIKTNYYFAPMCMASWWIWFYLLLEWVVKPSEETGLPETMKSMQFLDVFRDSLPGDRKAQPATAVQSVDRDTFDTNEFQMTAALSEVRPQVGELLALGLEAVGRWRAVPHSHLSKEQRREIGRLENVLNEESNGVEMHLARQSCVVASSFGPDNFHRPGKLSDTLVGPLQVGGKEYYYSVERGALTDEVDPSAWAAEERPIVTLEFVAKIVDDLVDAADVLEKSVAAHAASRQEEEVPVSATASRTSQHRTRFRETSEEEGEFYSRDGGNNHNRRLIKPDMLPWCVLQWVTHCVQAALGLSFVFLCMQDFFNISLFKDNEDAHHSTIGDPRRLQAVGPAWSEIAMNRIRAVVGASARDGSFAEWAEVPWRHAAFFEPVGASCHGLGESAAFLRSAGGLQVTSSAAEVITDVLVVATAYVHYVLADVPDVLVVAEERSSNLARQLRELRSVGQTPGAQLFCAATGGASSSRHSATPPCLWGSLAPFGAISLQPLRPPGSAVAVVPLDGKPWSVFTGALVDCAGVADFVAGGNSSEEWCLLMAGWDGERLGVVAQPLGGGASASGWMPRAGSRMSPQADVPLPEGEVELGFRSLHFEPLSFRLWAITADGHLAAWDLRDARSHGRWVPQWLPQGDASGPFQPAALCEAPGRGLLVVGRDSLGLPRLLAAALPEELLDEEVEAEADE